MNTAEWILVAFLSIALLIAIIIFIVFIVGLIKLTKEVKKVVISGQGIADNLKDMTSVGGLVKTFVNKYSNANKSKKGGNHDKESKKEE